MAFIRTYRDGHVDFFKIIPEEPSFHAHLQCRKPGKRPIRRLLEEGWIDEFIQFRRYPEDAAPAGGGHGRIELGGIIQPKSSRIFVHSVPCSFGKKKKFTIIIIP